VALSPSAQSEELSAGRGAQRLLLALLLLLAFAVYLPDAGRGLGEDEALALWVVRDEVAVGGAPGDALRGLRANLIEFAARVQQQPQPPLYFALLDAWVMIAGETVYAARLLSVVSALLALAFTAAAGRGWMIALALPLYFLPAAEAFLYAPLLAFSALGLGLLRRWPGRGSRLTAAMYALALAAALYTAWAALLLLPLHGAYALRRRFFTAWLLAAGGALLLFTPWALLWSPGIDMLLSSAALRTAAAAALTAALPVMIIALAGITGLIRLRAAPRPALIAMVAGLYALGVLAAAALITGRTDWPGAINALNAARDPLEPALIGYSPQHPLAHYDRLPDTVIRQGISVDLGWRHYPLTELAQVAAALDDTPALWLVMPVDDPDTWGALMALADTHTPGYRMVAGDTLFYRFDRQGTSPLAFRFGPAIEYGGQLDTIYTVETGQRVCPEIPLDVRGGGFTGLLYALSAGEHVFLNAFALDSGAGARAPCFSGPDAPGEWYLQLEIMGPDGDRLPLLEGPGELPWGERLIFGGLCVGPACVDPSERFPTDEFAFWPSGFDQ
jgi:hypothetical protein